MLHKRSTSDIQYYWSDAWLLLAIIYAGGGAGATLERIVATGDHIEHAIFNPDELESGLYRLALGGFIEEKDGVFSATDKVIKAYAKTTTPRRSVAKELGDVERLLKAKPYSAEPNPIHILKYPGFSRKTYERAVSNYLETAAQYAKKSKTRK